MVKHDLHLYKRLPYIYSGPTAFLSNNKKHIYTSKCTRKVAYIVTAACCETVYPKFAYMIVFYEVHDNENNIIATVSDKGACLVISHLLKLGRHRAAGRISTDPKPKKFLEVSRTMAMRLLAEYEEWYVVFL